MSPFTSSASGARRCRSLGPAARSPFSLINACCLHLHADVQCRALDGDGDLVANAAGASTEKLQEGFRR